MRDRLRGGDRSHQPSRRTGRPRPAGCAGVCGRGPAAALRALATRALAQIDGELAVPGVRQDTRVIRDRWGVPHIFAASDHDLFFTQGYVAAQDRLWQMEMWRRTAEGRLAEVLGPEAVRRDRMARLLKYRGPFDEKEFTAYHPDVRRLMTAFVAGSEPISTMSTSRS